MKSFYFVLSLIIVWHKSDRFDTLSTIVFWVDTEDCPLWKKVRLKAEERERERKWKKGREGKREKDKSWSFSL